MLISYQDNTENKYWAQSGESPLITNQWRIYIVKCLDSGVKILLISCSFWQNLAKSYVDTPPPLRMVGAPPRGNPGSATTNDDNTFNLLTHFINIFIWNIFLFTVCLLITFLNSCYFSKEENIKCKEITLKSTLMNNTPRNHNATSIA